MILQSGIAEGQVLNPNLSGTTGILEYSSLDIYGNPLIDTITGYGGVYGFLAKESGLTDLGIATHNISHLSVPARIGKLYWPFEQGVGQEVQLRISGLKYHDTGYFGDFLAPDFLFSFKGLESNFVPCNTNDTQMGWSFQNSGIWNNSGYAGGFYLVNTYNSALSGVATTSSAITTILNNLGSVYTNNLTGITGILSNYQNTGVGQMFTGVPGGSYIPVYLQLKADTIPYGPSPTYWFVYKVTNMFIKKSDIDASSVNFSNPLYIRFSGQSTIGYSDMVRPVYLRTGDNNATPTGWYYSAIISGKSFSTSSYFVRPSGYVIHDESYRLLPLHKYPTEDPNVASPVQVGGQYPATSFDNGMEIALELLWSADCGDAVGC